MSEGGNRGETWEAQATAYDGRFEPLTAVIRGPAVESVHRGALAVCDAEGVWLGGAGDPGVPVDLRSAAKPFQTLALVESGAAAGYSLTDEEIAVISASHSGEERHLRLVAGLLARVGGRPQDLVCGPQLPRTESARKALGGRAPSELHNMCSGKHAGMLLLAQHLGAPLAGYYQAAHPVQRLIAVQIASLLELSAQETESLFSGADGCGVPVVRLSLLQAARLYALLASGASPALARVRDALLSHPELVGGEGTFDTEAMRLHPGLLFKSGAEGVEGMAVPALGLGVAVKIADGSHRPVPGLLQAVLAAWGTAGDESLGGSTAVQNRAGQPTGRLLVVPEPARLRRSMRPGNPHSDVRIVPYEGRERDLIRFRREQWAQADEEILGRTYDWWVDKLTLAAHEGRNLVGVLGASLIGGVATLEELIVRSDKRGRGIGRALYTAFELEARARGSHKIVLRTPLGARAETFYLREGFRRECLFPGHHFGHAYLSLRKDLE